VNLLDSLLDAIVRLDGDALVMHVGEKPYVVTTSEATNQFRGPLAWGQVELSTRVLTIDAVTGMLGQILPLDQRSALEEFGATDYAVTAAAHPGERFTIVAARGGDDIWVEMRRQPKPPTVEATRPAPPEQAITAAESGSIEQPAEEPVHVAVTAPVETPVAAEEASAVELIEAIESPVPDIKPEPEPVPVAIAAETAHEEVAEPAQVEDVLADFEADAEIDLPFTIEVSPGQLEEPALAAGPSGMALTDLESGHDGDGAHDEESIDLDGPISEHSGLELGIAQEFDLDQDLDVHAFSLDADVEAGILAATQEWGDDVMTEGELGELLRATAAEVIAGETFGKSGVEVEAADVSAVAEPAEVVIEPAAVAFVEEPVASDEQAVSVEEEPAAAAGVPEPVESIETPAEPSATVVIAANLSPENGGSRETRELPTLVEYQLERDRAANALESAGKEQSVSSTEGVWTVSEDVNLDFKTSTPALSGEEEVAPSRPAAVVLPLTRQSKGEGGDGRAAAATNLQRLLRLAANRGAATVYVVANTAPLVRVDGEFSTLEGEPAISTAIVERLLGEVSPAGLESAPPSAEWLIDVPEIGRVRCLTFRDHRGPGIIFRMVPPRAIAADQLGLSAEVQGLCSEADGLVLVTGGRDSGRSTLLTSFVDLINRTRADHIITLESQIDFVHESKRSFISQREVRGEDAMGGSVRAACREEPDVLVIEDIRSHDVASLALEAAENGRLVFASVPGLSTSSAIERLIELFPADRREKVQASLAGSLRGVVSQVLLRKLRGGRIAAREVLLNTPAVAGLIMEGKTFQLSSAIEGGRRAGMISFAESLASLVREGVVHASHACRKAPSREQLIAALHRDGVDTTIAERLG
jgi:twitching motility protein PilT